LLLFYLEIFHTNPSANDTNFEADLLKLLTAKTLLYSTEVFTFSVFCSTHHQQIDFITRLKAGAAVKVAGLHQSTQVRDQLINWHRSAKPILTLRLVEIRIGKTWYSYITSVLTQLFCLP